MKLDSIRYVLSISICTFLGLEHVHSQNIISPASMTQKYPEFSGRKFHFQPAKGLGRQEGITRRDPSDIIKVNDIYYVWYTYVDQKKLKPEFKKLKASGYVGTIWYATSKDAGHTWIEKGRALERGKPDTFDAFAVFTPNIVKYQSKYYLYYTGVKPTYKNIFAFDNNSTSDYTAIGVAVADSPHGPFRRLSNNPVLITTPASKNPALRSPFDSYRIDDAALLVRDYDHDGDLDIWLYYKGRNIDDGRSGPAKTCMGLAVADTPAGPYSRINRGNPILTDSHEVIIWPHRKGIAAYASKSCTLEYAPDGIDFTSNRLGIKTLPKPIAPGCFRPDLTEPVDYGKGILWGVAMKDPGGPYPYLIRYSLPVNTK